ncbi:MAG: DUF362 domain-containing protein [Candidatus Brocadiia bacterium]
MSEARRPLSRRHFLSTSAGAMAAALGAPAFLEAASDKPRVVVASGGAGKDPREAAYQRLKAATEKLGGFRDLLHGKRVLIKLNATEKKNQDANTSPGFAAALLRLCKEQEPKHIKVIGQEWYGFDCKRKGKPTLREVIQEAGVELEELIHWWKPSDQYANRTPKGGGWSQLWVAKEIFEPDTVLINAPRVKTHAFTLYTGCVKNCIGLTYHMYAHHCTADRNPKAGADENHPARLKGWRLFPAKLSAAYHEIYGPAVDLNVVDACEPTFGWGGPDPERIRTFQAHKTIVSRDGVAADAVGMALLHDQEPKLIPTALDDWTKGESIYVKNNLTKGNYLAECHKLGAGQADLEKIQVDEITI